MIERTVIRILVSPEAFRFNTAFIVSSRNYKILAVLAEADSYLCFQMLQVTVLM
jgi:hypothetical protein